jgi:hypothetical protein
MTLELKTSLTDLKKRIDDASADGATSPVELQSIRDEADAKIAKIPAVVAWRAAMQLSEAVETFQQSADTTVEAMQRAALSARRMKLAEPERQLLKDAIEYQLAYIVAGYKSSIERL